MNKKMNESKFFEYITFFFFHDFAFFFPVKKIELFTNDVQSSKT